MYSSIIGISFSLLSVHKEYIFWHMFNDLDNILDKIEIKIK